MRKLAKNWLKKNQLFFCTLQMNQRVVAKWGRVSSRNMAVAREEQQDW